MKINIYYYFIFYFKGYILMAENFNRLDVKMEIVQVALPMDILKSIRKKLEKHHVQLSVYLRYAIINYELGEKESFFEK